MNTYDQIVASAYYVFGDALNTKIISIFLVLSRKNGNVFEEDELKLKELKGKMTLKNSIYKLNEGYSVSDIADCINFDMVTFFQNLKCSRDKCCNNYEHKNELIKRGK